MGRFLGRRLVALVAVLLGLTFAIFLVQAVLPSDPVRASLGPNATEQQVAQKRHELGFDQPLVNQYLAFLARVVQGDLGTSLRTRRPVMDDISEFAPATIELALFSATMSGLLAIGLGLWSVGRGWRAATARTAMVGAASMPSFFVAILFIFLFYRRLGWLPASGRGTPAVTGPTQFYVLNSLMHGDIGGMWLALRHLTIPGITLALAPAVAIGRVLRGSLLDVMRQDYVRTARAKGLSNRKIVMQHALRNAAGPALSMAGLQMGLLLTGVVVVELVMAWPGLGLYTTQAIQYSDFPAVIGVVLVLGVAYVLVNSIVDILQIIADPRLRDYVNG